MTFVAVGPPTTIDFPYRASYGAADGGRPVTEIEIATCTRDGVLIGSMRTGVLIDSGARTTLLRFEDSVRLGINVAEGRYPKEWIGGIVPGYGLRVARVTLRALILQRWIDLPAAFPLGPTNPPIRRILGRLGAFESHIFAFDHGHGYVHGL